MTRTGAGALIVIALAAGLVLRLARLDLQPMHNDEANQAVKFGALLERGAVPLRRPRPPRTDALLPVAPGGMAARPDHLWVPRSSTHSEG